MTRDLAQVLSQVEGWEPSTVAVGLTDPADDVATHGPVDEVFWLASVSKPLTAYGVLLAVQHGDLNLDEPVDLDGATGVVTVRHLLAHAGGLPPERSGPWAPPERRRVYCDWAYELLGDLVASRTGIAFEEHLELEVFGPLGMTDSHLGGPAGHGVHGTVADLLRFARELLDPGLLDARLLAEATEVAFPGLDGVVPGFGRQTPNDWGLGFELRGSKTDHWMGTRLPARAFGHFGLAGSFLWVDPARGVAVAALADQRFGPWAVEVWGPFNDRVVEVMDR